MNWVLGVVNGNNDHRMQAGYYRGPTGMQCLRHAERGRGMRNDAQPMTVADVKYEGFVPDEPWNWCPQCAKKWGRQKGHEYVIQKSDRPRVFEVIDLNLKGGDYAVFESPSYEACEKWVDGE